MAGFVNRSSVQQSINTRSWITVNAANKEGGEVNSGKEYIMKYLFNKSRCSYEIIVYDGTALRCEEVDNVEEFEKKSKLFNPNIEADASSLMDELCKCLEGCQASSKINLIMDEDVLKMSIKTKLKSTIPFSWTFILTLAPSSMLSRHVVQPLMVISVELCRRQQELFHKLERKDREVQDYKEQGTVVSRKHLETPFFDRVAYQNTANLNQIFLNQCKQPTLRSLTTDLSDIHRNVVVNMEANSKAPAEVVVGASATFDTLPVGVVAAGNAGGGAGVSSWNKEKRVAGSFVQDQLDGRQSPRHVEETQAVVMETKSPEDETLAKAKETSVNNNEPISPNSGLKEIEIAVQNLLKCEEAIKKEIEITKILTKSYFAKPNNILSVEDVLLELAASEVVDGVVYYNLIKVKEDLYTARYFENEKYNGFNEVCLKKVCNEFGISTEIVHHNVYTTADIKNEGERSLTLFASKRRGNARTNCHTFKRKVYENKNSVNNCLQVLVDEMNKKIAPSVFVLCFIAKKEHPREVQADAKSRNLKRYFLCTSKENWETPIIDYFHVEREIPSFYSPIEETLSFLQQQSLLMSLPNHHKWSFPALLSEIRHEQRFPTSSRRYPGSPRNKIMEALSRKSSSDIIYDVFYNLVVGPKKIRYPEKLGRRTKRSLKEKSGSILNKDNSNQCTDVKNNGEFNITGKADENRLIRKVEIKNPKPILRTMITSP